MKGLIVNEYVNKGVKNIEIRFDTLESINVRSTDMSYKVGMFVDVATVNGRQQITNKVIAPVNFLDFYFKGDVSCETLKEQMLDYVVKIKNENYVKLIEELVMNNEDYFVFPAAKSIHHAYIGGIAAHTLSMLEYADFFIKKYPSINADLLYAGAIMHDYAKIREYLSYGLTYSIEGNLLGHISMCNEEIANFAINNKINDKMDMIALKHLVLSHHGRMDYGSPKEPMLLEAYVLSVIDETDSKIDIIQNELNKTEKNCLTNSIMAFDRRRFFNLEV